MHAPFTWRAEAARSKDALVKLPELQVITPSDTVAANDTAVSTVNGADQATTGIQTGLALPAKRRLAPFVYNPVATEAAPTSETRTLAVLPPPLAGPVEILPPFVVSVSAADALNTIPARVTAPVLHKQNEGQQSNSMD